MGVKAQLALWGKILKPQGLRGRVRAKVWRDLGLPKVRLMLDGVLVPYEVLSCQALNRGLVQLSLKGIDTLARAEALRGVLVYAPQREVLREKELCLRDAVGLKLYDDGKELGPIVDVHDLPHNPMLVLSHHGREVLVPFQASWMIRLKRTQKVLHMQLPEGLLDLC